MSRVRGKAQRGIATMGNGPKYEFTCQPILNAFGAETDTRATLYRDGVKVKSKIFFFKRRAVNQCLEWRELYGAVPK